MLVGVLTKTVRSLNASIVELCYFRLGTLNSLIKSFLSLSKIGHTIGKFLFFKKGLGGRGLNNPPDGSNLRLLSLYIVKTVCWGESM